MSGLALHREGSELELSVVNERSSATYASVKMTVSERLQEARAFVSHISHISSANTWALSSQECKQVDRSTQSSVAKKVTERLLEARKLGRQNHLRMRVPPLVLGLTLCIVSAPVLILLSSPRVVDHDRLSVAVARVLSSLCLICGIASLQLAALPTDNRIVIVLNLVWSALTSVAFVLLTLGMWDFWKSKYEVDKLRILFNLPAMCVCASTPLRVRLKFLSSGTRARLLLVWRITAEVGLIIGILNILHGCLSAVLWQCGSEDVTFTRWTANICVGLPWVCAGAYLWFDKELPQRVHAQLSAANEAIVAASGIASVAGDRDPDFIISAASALCRTISLEKVLKDEFSNNTPAPEGHGFHKDTEHTLLGEIDAFISHSWHDNPDTKWATLQAWRESFKIQNNGREPRVWIDKYCIDQTDIATGLMCLPVFLAGSQQLVILYGDTYLERLWCVMELLIFLYMGGPVEDMHVRRLTTNTRKTQHLTSHIGEFSVDLAKCSRSQDRDMLLGCVEAGFGGARRFESLVRGVMAKLVRRESSRVFE